MQLEGEQLVLAPRAQVWDALNDPEILMKCIPGCEDLKQITDNELQARILAKVGPVRARFNGNVVISNLTAPSSYTLEFQGSGGAAGVAKGRSVVTLHDEDEQTRIHYTVDASVGGKLGQIGGRLINASAKKLAADFFRAFDEQVVLPTEVRAAKTVDQRERVKDDGAIVQQSVSKAPEVTALSVTNQGWGAELQRVMWLAIGMIVGAGLTHFWHL